MSTTSNSITIKTSAAHPATSVNPSGWEVYYLIFLSALLGLIIPLVLSGISTGFSLFLSPKSKSEKLFDHQTSRQNLSPELARSQLGNRINIRFFLGVNTALVLVCLCLILVPCISTLRGTHSTRGLISIISIATFASMALFYAVRKGDLTWLKTFRRENHL